MDIKEVINSKIEMEKCITEYITSFERDTGTFVKSIQLNKMNICTVSANITKHINSIDIEIRI